MTTVADKLREARALVAKGWTQGDWAKDADGEAVLEREPEAVCWCAGGAMFRVAGNGTSVAMLYDAFERVIVPAKVTDWNDAPERTQAEVLAAFDKAIELEEQSS